MSRMRSAVRPLASRSSWVPPTSTSMVAAEIFLDGRGEPRRREVELDRTARQPPPQREHRDEHDAAERAADEQEFAEASPAWEQRRRQWNRSDSEGGKPGRDQVQSPKIVRRQRRACRPACASCCARPRPAARQIRMEARLKLAECRNVRISLLIRAMPRLGVPSTARSCRTPSAADHAPLLRSTIPLQIGRPDSTLPRIA